MKRFFAAALLLLTLIAFVSCTDEMTSDENRSPEQPPTQILPGTPDNETDPFNTTPATPTPQPAPTPSPSPTTGILPDPETETGETATPAA